MDAVSPFCKNSKFPLSSTMQIVTPTLRFFASASAAATIVLMAARSKYFFFGKSFAGIAPARLSNTKSRLNMRAMLSIALVFFHAKICLGSAYLLYPGFRWFSWLIGPILDPTVDRNSLALRGACRFFPLAAALCFQQVPV